MAGDAAPGADDGWVAHGVRRLTAANPGPMTGAGTNTYLVGTREVVVIDPGPALDDHCDAVCSAVERAGGRLTTVVVTHTHPDHSPAARPLAERTGATVLGMAAPDDGWQDESWAPDALLADGDLVSTADAELTAVHTPGHASNHLCFFDARTRVLFTGDHVMNGSTVVILPPDGRMADYLASLRKIRALDARWLAPGHGDLLDKPAEAIDAIVRHRLAREAKVMDRLDTPTPLDDLVPRVYDDVPVTLHRLARLSLLAHLLKLEDDGRVSRDGERWCRSASA